MIFSHLINCNLAWGSAAKTLLTPLHILQKKAARLITNQNYKVHANALFKKLKILTIFDIHKLEIAKYMFKTIQHHAGTTPSSFTPLTSLHNYSTRNSKTNFFIKKSNTELGKKCKQVIGAGVWSEVPLSIKSLSFPMFVKEFKEYLATIRGITNKFPQYCVLLSDK